MENWGLIIFQYLFTLSLDLFWKSFITIIFWFRENLLFHIEDSDSERDRFEDGQVMAHELSHQVGLLHA